MNSTIPQSPDLVSLRDRVAVTAEEMRAIEGWMFEAGLPVAALMEKVVGRISQRITALYPLSSVATVGVWVGSGHNGGDALGVARELHYQGYAVSCFAPVATFKPLTEAHARYAQAIGLEWHQSTDWQILEPLAATIAAKNPLWIDGLLGFGLERSVTGLLAQVVDWLNCQGSPILSLDLPSGLHSDRGIPLGTAVKATHTLCLGLWKRGLWQDSCLGYTGRQERLDLDIPAPALVAVLGQNPPVQALTPAEGWRGLPLPIPPDSHKYRRGNVLIIAGSQQYRGAAVLAGLGARASGVGLTTLAVPQALVEQVSTLLPEAIVIGCDQTESGGILRLPPDLDWTRFQTIAWGSGLTTTAALSLLPSLLTVPCPLLCDADALNALGTLGIAQLSDRSAPTVLTPHPGEFRRLFPHLSPTDYTAVEQAQQASRQIPSHAIVVLKGARTVIAQGDQAWVNLESTPALARGGSGDVLAGLMAGLMAGYRAGTNDRSEDFVNQGIVNAAKTAVYWHAQAGLRAAQTYSPLGVDAFHLAQSLCSALPQARI